MNVQESYSSAFKSKELWSPSSSEIRVSNFQSIFYGPHLFGIADVAHSRSTDASVALSAKRQYMEHTGRWQKCEWRGKFGFSQVKTETFYMKLDSDCDWCDIRQFREKPETANFSI